jgi:hypothetical protein
MLPLVPPSISVLQLFWLDIVASMRGASARCRLGGEHRALAGPARPCRRTSPNSLGGPELEPEFGQGWARGDGTAASTDPEVINRIGIDLAEAELVIASPHRGRWSVANDERGMQAVVARLQGLGPELIVLEDGRLRVAQRRRALHWRRSSRRARTP